MNPAPNAINSASLNLLALLVVAALTLTGCSTSKPISGPEATARAKEFSFWSPHLLLTSDARYRKLEVEIDHVEGTGPAAEELKTLTAFFQNQCLKPDGVRVRVDVAIARSDARGKSHKALAELHLNGPESQDAAFIYFLFYDSHLAGTSAQEPCTLRLPHPAAVFIDRRYLKKWSWIPGAGDVGQKMLLHEAGHVLGLCTDQSHGDGLHCTNYPCLMNLELYIRPLRLLLPGPVMPQRKFCAACQTDLAAHRQEPPANNLRFLGPYCVRTETAYHVVATPGFVYVHVGALEDLDLADLERRRRAKYEQEPEFGGVTCETGELDVETARKLVLGLECDPLEGLRELAKQLKEKLSAASQKVSASSTCHAE